MSKFILFFLAVFLISGCKPENKSTNNQPDRYDQLNNSMEEVRGLNGVLLEADREQNIEPSYNSKVRGLSDPQHQSDW